MNSPAFSRRAISLAAVLLGLTTFAHAGPPLICRAIEIGQAKTLPWVDLSYQKGSGGYDLKNLTRDTLGILDSNPSVLVTNGDPSASHDLRSPGSSSSERIADPALRAGYQFRCR